MAKVNLPSLNLHQFGLLPEDENNHVFTFVFENPQKLFECKSVESSEVHYGGQRWTIVCMVKDERHIGFFLKWRYSDGQSASSVSCKVKYSLGLIHRQDYTQNKYFTSNQKFSSSQSLLGKSKFIPANELTEQNAGYLDETGKRVVLELVMYSCMTRFEKEVDTSPNARARKNASGYYFDTNTFILANHRFYLRVYPSKVNANGLPAVYLYLSTKAKAVSLELTFMLYLGEDTTDVLTYHFGEGAKYDGFGKTLSEPIYNMEKVTSVIIGAEITHLYSYKDAPLTLKSQSVYSPHVYKDFSSYGSGSYGSLSQAEAFQDEEGNFWKADLNRESKILTVMFDKGVHHYPQNKTKLLCWSATLLSQDTNRAQDVEMDREPMVGYFSNFIDDKGYVMTFPLELNELDGKGNPYLGSNGEMYFRIYFLSLQTLPHGMRGIPHFDYQGRHLMRAKLALQEHQPDDKNLEEMREMAASRASLSLLDSSRDERLTSGSSTPSGKGQQQLFKYDSLDALSNGDMMIGGDDDFGKSFFRDVLRHVASMAMPTVGQVTDDVLHTTSRDAFHGTREDMSTESGITVSDETSLLVEARPSPVDLGKQKEIVGVIAKFLQQRLPFRITEILEAGSLGTGTSTRSRMDVDLVIFSPDLPRDGQQRWMPSLLHATSNFIQNACANPDPFYPMPTCSCFSTTPYALQFTCADVDMDISFSSDWDGEDGGGYDALYEASCRQTTNSGRRWCSLAAAKLQKKFVADQPNEVKEIIKVVKHWRNCIQWKKTAYRPNSYLLSLLIIKAVDQTRSFEMKAVLQKMSSYILAPEMSISWSTYYLGEKYPVDFEPPSPLIRDPALPGFNVAATLAYWGQFRTEFIQWLKALGIPVKSVMITEG